MDKIIEIPDSGGLMVGSCYWKIVTQCVSGATIGLNSVCRGKCTVAIALAKFAKNPKTYLFRSDINIHGRLFDIRSEDRKKYLANIEVKLFFPSGGCSVTNSNASGRFNLRIDRSLGISTKRKSPIDLDLGEIGFVSDPGNKAVPEYYALMLH